jgi:hypothetical protein
VEQREDDGRHESRLSENVCNINRRNAYGVFDSHTYLYAPRLFTDSFREAASRTWPACMDGKRTLEEAAGDLVRAMNAP